MQKQAKPAPERITMPPAKRPYVKRDALAKAREAMGVKKPKGC